MDRYTTPVTLSFIYLLIFLGGVTLVVVTGLLRRLLHPADLGDHVINPSPEHWLIHHSPITDLAISFATVFGLATFVLHGVAPLDVSHEIAIGVAAGAVGVVVLKLLLGRMVDPIHTVEAHSGKATVTKEIPAAGFGQVEISVSEGTLKMAAKSGTGEPIPTGTVVEVLDRQESVIVVVPAPG